VTVSWHRSFLVWTERWKWCFNTVKSFNFDGKKFYGFGKKSHVDGTLIHGFCISGNKYKGQNYCCMGVDFMVEGEPRNLIPKKINDFAVLLWDDVTFYILQGHEHQIMVTWASYHIYWYCSTINLVSLWLRCFIVMATVSCN